MKYNIRKANQSDMHALLSLSRRVTNHNNRTFLPKEMVDDYLRSEEFAKEISDHINEIDILCLNNDIIGMCRFEGNIIESLMIAPDYQGTGAAACFMSQLLDDRFKAFDEIKVECFASNIRAKKFYEKIGFEQINPYKNKELNQDMCMYKKHL